MAEKATAKLHHNGAVRKQWTEGGQWEKSKRLTDESGEQEKDLLELLMVIFHICAATNSLRDTEGRKEKG